MQFSYQLDNILGLSCGRILLLPMLSLIRLILMLAAALTIAQGCTTKPPVDVDLWQAAPGLLGSSYDDERTVELFGERQGDALVGDNGQAMAIAIQRNRGTLVYVIRRGALPQLVCIQVEYPKTISTVEGWSMWLDDRATFDNQENNYRHYRTDKGRRYTIHSDNADQVNAVFYHDPDYLWAYSALIPPD